MSRPDASRPRLLLFEPNRGGHRPGYVGHLLHAWRAWGVPGRLVAAVSPGLFDGRPDLADLAGPTEAGQIDIVEVPESRMLEGVPLLLKGVRERRLLQRVVARHRPAEVLAMYGDHTQFALATGVRLPASVRVSLLLLRVSHHRDLGARGVRPALVAARKRALLWAAARSPVAGVFFSSDPAAVEAMAALGARAAFTPDPVPLGPCAADRAAVRARYGISPDRRLFLLYGSLAERKGVLTVLDALPLLPPGVAARTSVLFAGPVEPDVAPFFADAVAQAGARSQVEVALHDAFLHEAETRELFHAADAVLVPYLGHAGTSSVLIRAAGAGRPVVSQDRGLMGEQVRAHALGAAVDATDAEAVATAMGDPARLPFDAARARAFAEGQTTEGYARAVFSSLGLLPEHAR